MISVELFNDKGVREGVRLTMEEKKTTFINFFGSINEKSVSLLMNAVQRRLQEGTERFVILISSPGGLVGPGLSAYNFLKGIPVEVITHNYGSVDSVALAVFCAGKERYSVPNARFLLHGVGFTLQQGARFEEKQLDERMKSLQIDRRNIARIVAENSTKTVKDVENDMLNVITLNSTEAQEYGLVHMIKAELFPKGSEVIQIATQQP